ncbi:hypothetical protein [Nocardia amikacinitolerans]|uniref:hypothetical protein n=1 Tax=Nocardia amikacinitolerans TaxID=756689 RepID=UPI0020A341B9|nr:hypothetical protein [Nocardia amikacinitolerans]MCP2288687.1 hypothetical protein [Nocardia amikacinitolerans]
MRVNQFAASALLAIGAIGISAGAVDAQPTDPATAVSVRGVDQGIGYTAGPTSDGSGIVTTVEGGAFTLAGDARTVTLADASGRIVATLPMGFTAHGQTFGLTPRITDAGRTLTLTPAGAPAATTQHLRQLVDYDETVARKQHNAVVGALIGAGIGAVLGFFLGGVGALVTVPIGAGIGALIGFSTP